MRDLGIAPQLMATKGSLDRGPLLWMAWANISLPVPLSPVMRTEELCRAAIWAASMAERSTGSSPMMSWKVKEAWGNARSVTMRFRSEHFCSCMKYSWGCPVTRRMVHRSGLYFCLGTRSRENSPSSRISRLMASRRLREMVSSKYSKIFFSEKRSFSLAL